MELSRRLSQAAMLSSRLIRLSSAQNVRKLSLTASRLDAFNVQDKEDFEKRVLQSQTPVLVDFHAKWCGPCKILGPRLESVVAENKDKIHLAKVDIDDIPELAEEYDVSAVPSVLGLKNGQVQDMFVGVLDEDKLKNFVKKIIS